MNKNIATGIVVISIALIGGVTAIEYSGESAPKRCDVGQFDDPVEKNSGVTKDDCSQFFISWSDAKSLSEKEINNKFSEEGYNCTLLPREDRAGEYSITCR